MRGATDERISGRNREEAKGGNSEKCKSSTRADRHQSYASARRDLPACSRRKRGGEEVCGTVPGDGEVSVELGGLRGPGPEHPERVEDDGHAGQPHDGDGRLERRLHAAPRRPAPRHVPPPPPPAAGEQENKQAPTNGPRSPCLPRRLCSRLVSGSRRGRGLCAGRMEWERGDRCCCFG